MGRFAEPALLAALRTAESPEATTRLSAILKRAKRILPEEIRIRRTVEAVEWMNTPEAVRLLALWAGGVAGARLTEESKSALSRLTRR